MTKEKILRLIEKRKKSLKETFNDEPHGSIKNRCDVCLEIAHRLKELSTIRELIEKEDD